MAEYQVVDKIAHDAELKSIADSIRAKGGTTAPFNSATEMAAAVDAIQTGGGSGLKFDQGTFILSQNEKRPVVKHNLGVRPDFIVVWSDDFAGPATKYGSDTSVGFIWMQGMSKMEQRYSSANTGVGIYVPLSVAENLEYNRIFPLVPSSGAYGIDTSAITAEHFLAGPLSRLSQYIAGKTYNYFVAKAFWDKGEQK